MAASLQTYGRAGDAVIMGAVTAEISGKVPWEKKKKDLKAKRTWDCMKWHF